MKWQLPFAGSSSTVYLTTLPPSSLASLALAVFSLFAIMGFLTDVSSGGRQPWPILAANVLFSGTIAIGYGFTGLIAAGLRRPGSSIAGVWIPRRWGIAGIAAVLGVHLLFTATIGSWADALPQLPPEGQAGRLRVDVFGIAACVALSYSLFLSFINGTGVRLLAARAELRLAAEIHAVLVPPISRRVGEYEFYGRSDASGEVGGDLVDLTVADANGGGSSSWIGYVADVSGHGVSSGLLMGMTKSAAHMKLRSDASLAPLLDDLNSVLYNLKRPSMYLTFAGVAKRAEHTLEFIVAGHLPILKVTPAGSIVELSTPQLPLGFFEDTSYVSATIGCDPGDLLVLLTDGLTEIFDRFDREFGIDGVKEYLAAHRDDPLEGIAAGLLRRVRSHGAQVDDQTLLLIRRDAGGAPIRSA